MSTDNNLRKEINDVVDQEADLSADVRDDIATQVAEQIEGQVEGLPKEQRQALIAASVAAIAIGSSTWSSPADASISSFINRLISGAIEPIVSVLGVLTEGMNELFGAFVIGGAESNAAAVTSAADAQNHVRTQLAEGKLKNATAPTPDECISDAMADEAIRADVAKNVDRESALHALTAATTADNPHRFANDLKEQMSRHGRSGANLHASSILKGDGINTDEEKQAAADFLKNCIGQERRSPRNEDINRAIRQEYGNVGFQMQADKAKAITRRQIAMTPLVDAVGARDNTHGKSELTVMREEVRRTYGANSDGWRKAIRDYADSTPVLAELTIQTSFQNHIALKQFEQLEAANMVEAAHLLELLDAED